MAFKTEEVERRELWKLGSQCTSYLLIPSSDSSDVCPVVWMGVVSNMKNKRLRDVHVEIKGKDRMGYTDKKGKYKFDFEQVRGDSVSVLFSKDGFKDKAVTVPWMEPKVDHIGFMSKDSISGLNVLLRNNIFEFHLDVKLEKID